MKTHVLARGQKNEPDFGIQTLPSGDIEVVKTVNTPTTYYNGSVSEIGGVKDFQICSIPKSKIPDLITFLQGVA